MTKQQLKGKLSLVLQSADTFALIEQVVLFVLICLGNAFLQVITVKLIEFFNVFFKLLCIELFWDTNVFPSELDFWEFLV